MFAALTTILTFYALLGDDIRVSSTPARADVYFDNTTLIAIAIFSIEVFVCAVGKEGYFLGFFFYLDLVTTITLVMDHTIVARGIDVWMTGDSDAEESKDMSALRASKMGSKAGRIVRIIRLIRLLRIVKLYKHAVEARQARIRKQRLKMRRVQPNDDDEDESDDEDGGEGDAGGSGEPESRVGKRLSELTTRRVIVLVLVMLFVVPQLTIPSFEFPPSPQYGADVVFRNWKRWADFADKLGTTVKEKLLGEGDPNVLYSRQIYEKSLLTFIYYHNWNYPFEDCPKIPALRLCPADFHAPLIWIGYVKDELSKDTLIQQEPGPHLQHEMYQVDEEKSPQVAVVNKLFNNDEWLFAMGDLPGYVLKNLSKKWVVSCDCGPEKCIGINLMMKKVMPESIITAGPDDVGEDPLCPGNVQEKYGLRKTEFLRITPLAQSSLERAKYGRYSFYFDMRTKVRYEALLNVGQTLFVVCVLGLGALFFSKDANTLVLQPIERMIAKMEKIRDNPLAAMKLGDEEFRREEHQRKEKALELENLSRFQKWWASNRAPQQEPMETAILEKTIIKIGGLLALGFGEAGANIIGQNMKGSDSATVDAMVPGRKVDAIFGFCNIRNFTDATEILQDKVMLFVNQIGEIVHGVVDEYCGVPNKNIGDAFLLVWQLHSEELGVRQRLSDLSILSYCRITLGVNQSPILADYRDHPGLLQRLPTYRVSLGMGFHSGWAIEGAIGSEFKIDASYLSPNVNIASRLEAATKQFGVSMLMSRALYELCSTAVCKRCRVVDRVMVKGSNIDIGLYVLDLDVMIVRVREPVYSNFIKNRYKVRQIREQMKLAKMASSYSVEEMFTEDQDIIDMRKRYTVEFLKKFDMAYRNYEAGEWAVAKDMLESTKNMIGGSDEDGPSITLLSYMNEFDYVAPATWTGFRYLTEK